MNGRMLARLGLGLLGVLALAQVLFGIVNLVTALAAFSDSAGRSRPALLLIGLPIAVLLGLSYVLMFHNASVAEVIFPDLDGAAGAGGPDLPRVLVGLLGVLVLAMALPQLVRAALTVVPGDPYLSREMVRSRVRDLAGYGLEALLALFLILRPQRVLALWHPASADGASR